MKISKKRSFLKAITYRFVCSAETFLVTWIITGSVKAGSVISGILFFSKILTFYLHERVWERFVKWGKTKTGTCNRCDQWVPDSTKELCDLCQEWLRKGMK